MTDNNDSKQMDSNEDNDEAPQDIRSRIAAFEQNSSAAPTSPKMSGSSSSSKVHAVASSNRTTLPSGTYDPLQAMSSPPKIAEPTIIKLAERPRGSAPASTNRYIKPSSNTSNMPTRVALPGLGARTPSNSSIASASSSIHTPAGRPSSLSQSRPWPPVKEPSSPSEIDSAIHTAMSDTPPVGNLSQAESSSTSSNTAQGATSPTAPSSSSTLPLPPPQLPSRKNSNASTTSASTSFSSFTNIGSVSSEPSSITSRAPPPLPAGKPAPASTTSHNIKPASETSISNASAPRLPPRKQGSTSSSISTNSALDALPRPPQRTSTLSATNSPSGTPTQSRSSSVSQYTPSNLPSRSSTTQSEKLGYQGGAPSLSTLPPRPREQSTSSSRSMPPPPPHRAASRDGTTSSAPPPLAARPNGLQRSPNTEGAPKRYDALWDKLVLSFAQPQATASAASGTRLDAIVVRQVWKMSNLNDNVLSRIWNQCDVNRQGSLDKAGFCKGLILIDSELNSRRRRRTRA